jgi:hypothetical protein
MANRVLDEPATSERIEYALDFVRLDEIGRLAALASSYWRSAELAADRGDTLTLITHCKQVAIVTREAFAIVKTLGSEEVGP